MVDYSLKEISNDKLKYVFELSITKNEVDKAIDNKVLEYSKNIKLPGFRPGKVNPSTIREKFSSGIKEDIIKDTIRASFNDIHKKFNLATDIDINIDKENQENFAAKLSFEIIPDTDNIDLHSINITNFICDISENDITKEINKMKNEKTTFIDLDKPIETGDATDINFNVYINKKPIKGGSAKKYRTVVGSGSMIKPFEDALLGMKKGEKKIFDFQFPENYGATHLAGKNAQAEISILNVLSPDESEKTDDEFAKSLKFNDYNDLYENVKKLIQQKSEYIAREVKIKELFDQFDKISNYNIPEALVEKEIESLKPEVLNENDSNINIRKIAERRVRAGIIVLNISKKHNIKAEQNDILNYIKTQIIINAENGQQLLHMYMNNNKYRNEITRQVLEKKTIDHILSNTSLTEKHISYIDLVNIANSIGETENETHESEIEKDTPEQKVKKIKNKIKEANEIEENNEITKETKKKKITKKKEA